MIYSQLACQALLITVFAVSAAAKGGGRGRLAQFAASLEDFGWLPAALRAPTAVAVVGAEAVAVALLAVRPVFGAALVLVLLAAFTVVTLRAGRAEACHCFGAPAPGAVNPGAGGGAAAFVTRNALLAAGALVTALASRLAGGGAAAVPPAVLALGLGLAAGLVVVRWEDLVYLLRGPSR